MNHPEPNITVNVDVTNPGQFFACCGLLELADRLWPGAEGWFVQGCFCIACGGTLDELLAALSRATITSSVTDEGLKRLGTLLSKKKASLSEEDQWEKARLRKMWQEESLRLGAPFNLLIDWWRDERNERTPLKTWAAKQFILEIVRPLLRGTVSIIENPPFTDLLSTSAKVDGLPLYFDSDAQCQSTAIDTGFSLYALRNTISTAEATRPALELFAFIGLQRFQPRVDSQSSTFRFTVWPAPLPVVIAAVAATGYMPVVGGRRYAFRLLNRTKYMKAYLPATPFEGD